MRKDERSLVDVCREFEANARAGKYPSKVIPKAPPRNPYSASTEELIIKRFELSGVPKRFHSANIEQYPDDVRHKVDRFLNASGWRTLLLSGDYGVGKTHLLSAIARMYCKKASCLFTTSKSASDRMIEDRGAKHFNQYSLVLIDEMGRSYDTRQEKDRMLELIDYRYANEMPLVLSGNFNFDQIKGVLGGAASDRLRDGLIPLTLTGPSRRSSK